MSIRIAVVNFWEGAFDEDFFSYFLSLAVDGDFHLANDPSGADVVISSVFGKIKTIPEKTIFYTGENVRPDFRKCRFSLSFDVDAWDGRNFYLPLWYSRIAWPGFKYRRKVENSTHGNEALIPLSVLTSGRPHDGTPKSKFCVFFAGNPEVNRINLFRKICSFKPVDGFGLLFGKPLFSSKSEVLKDYKFCLCAENDFYPGYITEKLFDAYSGGAVPIYFGGVAADGLINRRAFINFDGNSDTMLQQIIALDGIDAFYQRVHREPLLLAEPKLEPAVEFLRHCIIQVLKS
jgi:hypothetical protein